MPCSSSSITRPPHVRTRRNVENFAAHARGMKLRQRRPTSGIAESCALIRLVQQTSDLPGHRCDISVAIGERVLLV